MIIIHVNRRQAALIGALLEADLVERGVVEPTCGSPFDVTDGPPWVPSEEENTDDKKLLCTIAATIDLVDRQE